MKQYIVTHQLRSAQARNETFLGRQFRVVPSVLVRSQVLRNNLGATFLPAEEITPEWAALWNNIPVLVGDHPTVRGHAISGRSPQLLNERGVGNIYNAQVEQEEHGVRRLIAEVWLDVARAAHVEGFQAVLDAVNSGKPVELSTGFGVSIDARPGAFNGQAYEVVLHPGGADHLIISTEITGACSVRDGCGLNVNEAQPMPAPESTATADKGMFTKLREHVTALLARKPAAAESQWHDSIAHRIQREIEIINQISPSDQERSNVIRDALQSKFGSQDKNVVVCDVYSEARNVVFWFMTPFGPEPAGAEYFQCAYTEGEGAAYNFEDPKRVRRMTVYEPVASNGATAATAANTKPCGCHSEGTNMDATERKGLVDELMAAVNAALKPVTDSVNKIGEQATAAANAAVAPLKESLDKALGAVEALKTQVSSLSTAVNAERDKERQALVTALSANAKTKDLYTAADLEAMNLEGLRKVAQLAEIEVASYAGRGGPQATNVAAEDELTAFAQPVPYFAKSTPASAASGAEVK